MKPQELRIGNYLHDRGENLCQVTELERERIYAPVIGKTITGLPNKPIEINEEWLLKLGFEKKAECNFMKYIFQRGIIHAYTNAEKVSVELGNKSGYSFGYSRIEYVHQMQNLYYTLTGEELTIKE